PSSILVARESMPRGEGPVSLAPLGANDESWQGQLNPGPLPCLSIAQPRCGQTVLRVITSLLLRTSQAAPSSTSFSSVQASRRSATRATRLGSPSLSESRGTVLIHLPAPAAPSAGVTTKRTVGIAS